MVSISDLESEERYLIGKSRPSGGNIFTRGLRRACECVGAAVVATGKKKVGPTGSGAEKSCGIGGLDGAVEDLNLTSGNAGLEKSSARVEVMQKIKRTLWCKKGPVQLKHAKVRSPLDE